MVWKGEEIAHHIVFTEPMFLVQLRKLENKKKSLLSQSSNLNLCRCLTNAFNFILKFASLSVSDLLFQNKTCRFVKNSKSKKTWNVGSGSYPEYMLASFVKNNSLKNLQVAVLILRLFLYCTVYISHICLPTVYRYLYHFFLSLFWSLRITFFTLFSVLLGKIFFAAIHVVLFLSPPCKLVRHIWTISSEKQKVFTKLASTLHAARAYCISSHIWACINSPRYACISSHICACVNSLHYACISSHICLWVNSPCYMCISSHI